MNTPVIGVTVGTGVSWRKNGCNYRSYAAPVEAAGGLCVPMGTYAGRNIRKCHGLLITGGWDIDPDLYERLPGDEGLSRDEVKARYRIECESRRDECEMLLIREALGLGLPVLAICRGIQALNVVLARRLIPDISSCLPNALTHKSPGFGVSLSHEVNVEPGSVIERAYGTRRLLVNTRHHQGMTREMIPSSLRVTAVAPDGVVEAVESVGEQFIVGVQWHPERRKDAFIYDISAPLFAAFVEACRRTAQ